MLRLRGEGFRRSPGVPGSRPHVAWRPGCAADRGRDRRGRDRRLDRTRSGRGREAHRGAGSAGREAAGDDADLLSGRGPRGSPPPTPSRPWARAQAARSSSCCCNMADDSGSAPAPITPTASRKVRGHGVEQMCEKPVAPAFWAYDDVAAHWDSLMLRAHVVEGRRAHALSGRRRDRDARSARLDRAPCRPPRRRHG